MTAMATLLVCSPELPPPSLLTVLDGGGASGTGSVSSTSTEYAGELPCPVLFALSVARTCGGAEERGGGGDTTKHEI